MKIFLTLLLCLGALSGHAQDANRQDPCATGQPVLLSIELNPEPVGRYLRISAPATRPPAVSIFGASGSEVTSLVASIQADVSSVDMDLHLLPPGIYYVQSDSGVRTVVKE